jgi:hypothetical protein
VGERGGGRGLRRGEGSVTTGRERGAWGRCHFPIRVANLTDEGFDVVLISILRHLSFPANNRGSCEQRAKKKVLVGSV